MEATVPVSVSFIDPAATPIAPESVLPVAIETGVMLEIERLLIVESFSTSNPKLLSTDVLTLSTVIELSKSLLASLSNIREFVLAKAPPPERVSVLAPRLREVPV